MYDEKPHIEERVRTRAYFLWEEDGRPDGRSDYYWRLACLAIEDEDFTSSGIGEPVPAATKTGKSRKSKVSDPSVTEDGTRE